VEPSNSITLDFSKFIFLPPSHRLDYILFYLNHDERPDTILEIEQNLKWAEYDIMVDKEINIILDKLVKDGYVLQQQRKAMEEHKWVEKGTEYYISFEGRYFVEKGGYRQQDLDKEQERKIKNQRLRRADLKDLILTVGAILAGLYALYTLLKVLHHLIHPLFFLC